MKTNHVLTALVLSLAFDSSAITYGQDTPGTASVTAPASDPTARFQGMKMVKIPAGKTADLGLYVNSTGTVNMIIKTRDGTDEVPEMWWIKWGFGSITSIGKQKGTFHTPVPVNLFKGIVSAKLRVRAGASDTVVYLRTSGAAPAGGPTFQW